MVSAERETAQKRAALDRFHRDYEAGDLGAASYERQVARVTDELAALDAQTGQLTPAPLTRTPPWPTSTARARRFGG